MNRYVITAMPALRIASLAVLLTACGTSYTDTELVERAKNYYAEGNYQSALIELKSASSQNPANADARFLLAQVRLDLGDPAAAEKEINRAMELDVAEARAQPILIRSLLLQGKVDQVLQEGSQIADDMTDADRATVLAMLGEAFSAKEEFEKADFSLDQALRIDPDNVWALIARANVQGKQGFYEEARLWNQRVLEIDESFPEAWAQMGQIELDLGNYPEAEAAYTRAINLNSYTGQDLLQRARVRLFQNDYDGVNEDIQQLKKSGFGKHPYVNYVQGVVSFRQGAYEDAKIYLGEALNAAPRHIPAKAYLASTHLALGEYEQARILAEQVLAAAPTSMLANELMGAVHVARADYGAAVEVLQGVLSDTNRDIEPLKMLGSLSLMQGKTEEAVAYFKQLAEIDPDSSQNLDMLLLARMMNGEVIDEDAKGGDYNREFLYAFNLFQRGKLRAALQKAQALHEAYPAKVDPLNLMASCYLAAAQWESARAPLIQALAREPANSTATRALAKLEINAGSPANAKKRLESYLSKKPEDSAAIILLSDAENRLGNQYAAEVILETAYAKFPEKADLLLTLAKFSFNQGKIKLALSQTSNLSANLLIREPELLMVKGKSEMRGGQFAAAETSFAHWVKLAPNEAQAHHFYADSLGQNGKTTEALREYDLAIKLEPEFTAARIGEATLYLQQGNLEKAEFAVKELRSIDGDTPAALWLDGWLALLNRDYVRAEENLTVAQRQVKNSQLTVLLAAALWNQKKHEQALTVLRDRLTENPQDLPIQMELAATLLTLGRNDEAGEIYQQVVESYPRQALALNNLAFITRDSDPEQALEYATRAHELMPTEPYILDTLGTLLMASGDLERAAEMINEATSTAPENAEFKLHQGQLLLRTDQLAEATKVLNEVIAMAPDSDFAAEAKKLLSGE